MAKTKYTKKPRRTFTRKINKQKIAKAQGLKWISSVNRDLRMKPNDVYFRIVRRTDPTIAIGLQEASGTDHCLMSRDSKLFKLTDVHNHSELTALFDYFRIKAVECRFTPFGNVLEQSNPAADSQQALMRIMYKIDNDDSTTPTFSEMKESGCKSFMVPSEGFVITLRPKVLASTYSGAMGTGYRIGNGHEWIDTDDDPPHYCLKWIMYVPHINPSLAPGYPHYQVEYRYVLEFKGLI